MQNSIGKLEEDIVEEDMEAFDMSKASLRTDNELFDDDSYVVHRLINARLVTLPNGGENWEILDNDEVMFVVPGVRLTKQEKKALKTANGLNTLLNEYKLGNKSVINIKTKLRLLDNE
jgi:hypothetical protein